MLLHSNRIPTNSCLCLVLQVALPTLLRCRVCVIETCPAFDGHRYDKQCMTLCLCTSSCSAFIDGQKSTYSRQKACGASGEWLCWPCKVYEEEERAKGHSQSQIRPPRWEVQGGQLQEGSKAAHCALCPVRQGAFRRTADGKAWIHEVCLQPCHAGAHLCQSPC